MQFAQCPICNLNLPISIMQAVIVKHQGKLVRVMICNSCKEKKEKEAQERK